MTECRNPELQDLLPDYVSESLGDADRVRVFAHLAACDACTVDLDLLRRVRAARPVPAAIDVRRIVSALPAPPAVRTARPALQLHNGKATSSASPSITATTGPRRLLQGSSLWRVAAAVGVVLTGGMSVLVARHGLVGANPTAEVTADASDSVRDATAGTPALSVPSVALAEPAVVRAETTVATASATASAPRPTSPRADVPLSYGGLDDVTDAELQRLLDRLEKWDGATNSEPLPTISPVTVSPRGGTLP